MIWIYEIVADRATAAKYIEMFTSDSKLCDSNKLLSEIKQDQDMYNLVKLGMLRGAVKIDNSVFYQSKAQAVRIKNLVLRQLTHYLNFNKQKMTLDVSIFFF